TYTGYRLEFFTPVLTIVLAAVSIIWQLMPLFTASFGSDLNVSRFRIYPLGTRSLFLIDMMLGLFDPVALLSLILVAGIFTGVVLASPRSAPVAGLGLVAFVAFNIALARYVQRLLAGLFASRRRKELLALFVFLLLLAPQTLIMMRQRPANRIGKRHANGELELEFAKQRFQDMQAVGRAIRWTPPGVAAAALNPEALDFKSEFLILFVGLLFVAGIFALEFNRLASDYQGSGTKRKARKKRPAKADQYHPQSDSLLKPMTSQAVGEPARVFGSIEAVLSPVSAAVFEKDIRYIYRSPRALLIAIAPIVGSVIFILPGSPFNRSAFAGQYRLAGILLYALVVSSQLINNCFAFDWH
ncbi:MAG: hypothetical protein ACREDR_46540, partial [Blastocatellia bacterium]